jgi:NAD(P)-dependent dehydrogenase (short-subunit alcohol dehydrogenase family)
MSADLVFVSGGSSGIGQALVAQCPWRGARIWNLSRREAPGVQHCAVDLSRPAGWRRAASLFARELAGFRGARAIFFHCAGTLDPIGFAGEVDAVAYERAVLLNAASLPVLGSAFLRALRGCASPPQSWIVNVGSGAAGSVYEGWTSYCAGKAASDHWVRVAAAEQKRRGSRCTIASIAPGVVETEMQRRIRASSERDFPDLARFQELFDKGILRDVEVVARDYWELVQGPLESGAVIDLRSRQGG